MSKILEKLNKIQVEIKVPKGNYNAFGKYKYRSAEDILEGAKPLLEKYNCTLTVSDGMELIGERYYIQAIAKLTDCETGECFINGAFAREEEVMKGMSAAQVTGATSSYARKYALNGLFALDSTDVDPDMLSDDPALPDEPGMRAKADAERRALAAVPIEKKYAESLEKEIERTGTVKAKFLKAYGVTAITELTFPQFLAAMEILEPRPDKKTVNLGL